MFSGCKYTKNNPICWIFLVSEVQFGLGEGLFYLEQLGDLEAVHAASPAAQ